MNIYKSKNIAIKIDIQKAQDSIAQYLDRGKKPIPEKFVKLALSCGIALDDICHICWNIKKDILEAFIESLDNSGFSVEQKQKLLRTFILKTKEKGRSNWSELKDIAENFPSFIESAKKVNLGLIEIFNLINNITENIYSSDLGDTFKHLATLCLVPLKGIFSINQILKLINLIIKPHSSISRNIEALPSHLDTLLEFGYLSDQIINFTKSFITDTGQYNFPSCLKSLPSAINTLKSKTSLSKIEILDQILQISKLCIGSTDDLLKALPISFDLNLTLTQFFDLINKIRSVGYLSSFGSFSFPHGTARLFPATLEALKKENFTPEQIIELFEKIISDKEDSTNKALNSLPIALEALRTKAHLNPQETIDFIIEIIEITKGYYSYLASDGLLSLFERGLSCDEIKEFYRKIIKKTGSGSWHLFQALKRVLKTPYSLNDILKLYEGLPDECENWKGLHEVYAHIPEILELNYLTVKEIVLILSGFVNNNYEYAYYEHYEVTEVYREIPKLLQIAKEKAKLSGRQITDILTTFIAYNQNREQNFISGFIGDLRHLLIDIDKEVYVPFENILINFLTPEQITNMCKYIIKKCPNSSGWALRQIPFFLMIFIRQLNLTPQSTMNLIKSIFNLAKDKSSIVLHNLLEGLIIDPKEYKKLPPYISQQINIEERLSIEKIKSTKDLMTLIELIYKLVEKDDYNRDKNLNTLKLFISKSHEYLGVRTIAYLCSGMMKRGVSKFDILSDIIEASKEIGLSIRQITTILDRLINKTDYENPEQLTEALNNLKQLFQSLKYRRELKPKHILLLIIDVITYSKGNYGRTLQEINNIFENRYYEPEKIKLNLLVNPIRHVIRKAGIDSPEALICFSQLLKLKISFNHILNIIKFITENYKDNRERVFRNITRPISHLIKDGFTLKKTLKIINALITKSGTRAGEMLNNFPNTYACVTGHIQPSCPSYRSASNRAIIFLNRIADTVKVHTGTAFEILNALFKANLTQDEIINFLEQLTQLGWSLTEEETERMIETTENLLENGITPDQIILLYANIIKTKKDNLDSTFYYLSYLLKTTKKINLNPNNILELLNKLLNSTGNENIVNLLKIISEYFSVVKDKGINTDFTYSILIQIINFVISLPDELKVKNLEKYIQFVAPLVRTGVDIEYLLDLVIEPVHAPEEILESLTKNTQDISTLSIIKSLYLFKRVNSKEFSNQWLTSKALLYLLDKLSQGKEKEIREAIKLLLKYDIIPTFEAIKELVEFNENYPFIKNALEFDPSRKNNYSDALQEEVKLDFIYYITHGQYKKAEIIARLLRKNRNETRLKAAIIALRFIDETTIDLGKISSISDLEILAEKAKDGYKTLLSGLNEDAKRILENDGNKKYVQKILNHFGINCDLNCISVEDFLKLLQELKEKVVTENVMFKLDDVLNTALTELRDTHGQFTTEALSFKEVWFGEMEMATSLHREIITTQTKSQKPLLVVLNERTAPFYFGRDFLPKSYAQRFGIVTDVHDEEVLDTLGKVNISDEELRTLGTQLFSSGRIVPLHGFKIGSSNNDIRENTLGIYIKNITRMMELIGGEAAFVDMSRRRVGGSTAFLYDYLNKKGLANITPHGKILERGGRPFDGPRMVNGLQTLDAKKQSTWHLIDPCKIADFNGSAEIQEELKEYFGGQKPYADDRDHVFYSMSHIESTGPEIAPRFVKSGHAWFIPDIESGLIPIYQYIDRMTGRSVPEYVNGDLDEIVPYIRFSPYLIRRLDSIFVESGIADKVLKKRFYGSDCFGYYILTTDLKVHEKEFLIAILNQSFHDHGLKVTAVDSGKTIDILQDNVNKGTAAAHFSRITGIDEDKIVRIGDQPFGNDRELLSNGRPFNVGKNAGITGLTDTTSKGPDGVLEALEQVEREGFEAIVFDIDGTIESDSRVLQKIKKYLEEGKHVAIITGRGESVRRKFIARLEKLSPSTKAKQNLFLYLYNGALYTKII